MRRPFHREALPEALPQVPSNQCSASGCPMAGTMTYGVLGDSPKYCWLHFQCAPMAEGAITAGIRNRLYLWRSVERLTRALNEPDDWPAVVADAERELQAAGRTDLSWRHAYLADATWLWQLRHALGREIQKISLEVGRRR